MVGIIRLLYVNIHLYIYPQEVYEPIATTNTFLRSH